MAASKDAQRKQLVGQVANLLVNRRKKKGAYIRGQTRDQALPKLSK